MNPARCLIGNDVVDLSTPEANRRSANGRFLERVFTPHELSLIVASIAPDRTLGMIWAAKEAVFKAAVKQAPETIFAHRKFELVSTPLPPVKNSGPVPEQSLSTGRLIHEGRAYHVRWDFTESWVHALAWLESSGSPPIFWRVARHEGDESRGVRSLAIELLAEKGWSGAEIRGRPPRACDARGQLPLDVSLSHDGPFAAAAICPS